MSNVYEQLKQRALAVCRQHGLLQEQINVEARTLTVEEAIGSPEDQDFPIQKGKERLMQAEFRGACGQAFTDRYGDFSGTLEQVFSMSLENNYRRAIFVAALNAVLRHLGLIERTIHCRDEEPRECAAGLVDFLLERYGRVRVTHVGFQPRMIEAVSAAMPLRVLDLDPDNIGTRKFGVEVEGADRTADAVAWADLLLVTGTVLVNDTIGSFLCDTPVVFYGTTIAGAAYLMGWQRYCGMAR